jgi:hypothetical protein
VPSQCTARSPATKHSLSHAACKCSGSATGCSHYNKRCIDGCTVNRVAHQQWAGPGVSTCLTLQRRHRPQPQAAPCCRPAQRPASRHPQMARRATRSNKCMTGWLPCDSQNQASGRNSISHGGTALLGGKTSLLWWVTYITAVQHPTAIPPASRRSAGQQTLQHTNPCQR